MKMKTKHTFSVFICLFILTHSQLFSQPQEYEHIPLQFPQSSEQPMQEPFEPSPQKPFEPQPEPFELSPPEPFEPQISPQDSFDQPSPMNVRKCANVIQSDFDGEISNYVNDGDKVLLQSTGSVYRSDDGGITWQNIIHKFTTNATQVLVREGPEMVYKMIQSLADSNIIYFIGNFGNIWVTRDGGETIINYYHPLEFQNINPHPIQKGWLLGTSYNPCCWGIGNCRCTFDAYFSTDSGETWNLVKANAKSIVWGDTNTNEKLAYVFFYPPNTSTPILARTYDLFQTYSVIARNVNTMLFVRDALSLLITTEDSDGVHLLVSMDNGDNFYRARFPSPSAGEFQGFTILDDSLGSAMVGVQTDSEIQGQINLYNSDVLGSDFTISLRDVIKSDETNDVDFAEMVSLQGVYWANHREGEFVRSMFSYDRGGEWFYLQPPFDQTCEGCNLHIHGSADGLELPMHFGPEPMGIVIVHANVGSGLSKRLRDFNLYISRDAGLTWRMLRKGTWEFAISRDGNSLMLGYPSRTSCSVLYSLNDGYDWEECLFTDPNDTKVHTVVEIYNDLSHIDSSFWISTTWFDRITFKRGSSIFYVNLASPNPYLPCTDDDYEVFVPHGPSDSCYLGVKTFHTRKKPDRLCDPDPNVLNIKTEVICNCTRSDYFCSYCYVKKPGEPDQSKECIPDPSCPIHYHLPKDCVPGQSYPAPPRFRKVIGTRCLGEVEELLIEQMIVCPYNRRVNSKLSTAAIIGVVFGSVFVIIAIIYAAFHFTLHCSKKKETIENPAEDIKDVELQIQEAFK